MTDTKTGRCLCGAVSFTIRNPADAIGACHCAMCRRWTGGPMMALTVAAGDIDVAGAEHVTAWRSSDWATRSFCTRCGSALWYRLLLPDAETGEYHVALGLLDDPSGIRLTREIFIEEKPDAYAFAGGTEKLTGAELFALHAGNGAGNGEG